MKKLYRMYFEYGRLGGLEGLFVAEESDVGDLIGREIYFGEVLGKHSNVYGKLEASDFTVVCDNQEVIDILVQAMRGESISGYNPFDYYEEDEDEEE